MARDQAYRLAEMTIKETRLSGSKYLNLSGRKLTELPDALEHLTHLEYLYIENNQLGIPPQWIGNFTQLRKLNLSGNQLTALPESLGQLNQLHSLLLSNNQLTVLPDWLGKLTQLQELDISYNQLISLPESLTRLTDLRELFLSHNKLTSLPEWVGNLTELELFDLSENQLATVPEQLGNLTRLHSLDLSNNQLTTMPESISQLGYLQLLLLSKNQFKDIPTPLAKLLLAGKLRIESGPFKLRSYSDSQTSYLMSKGQLRLWGTLSIDNNPLNPELTASYGEGNHVVLRYLRAKAEAQINLYEAKLILIGEGEVGKTCLMDALLGNSWQEHPSTHGIEIKPIKVTDPDIKIEITLNGWDFGGQRVYRPTHQLFFSAPAVYLVVWKPREGPQQGFVKEWIQLVKRREPTAKILVVATHGGPGQRQPDIDRQELWDLFGKDTIVDFFYVESKPDKKGNRRGIKDLKKAITRVAVSLPEVGRTVPKNWQDAREALKKIKKAYLPLDDVIKVCRKHKMDDEQANLFITIEHRLGHLIHYQHDPLLRDIVVLKPDWLATAISFVLDDEETRINKGLVHLSHLGQLWNDPKRSKATRYPATLHKIFVRLMERFDLCYRVVGISVNEDIDPGYLIAQLVPDVRPERLIDNWTLSLSQGDLQQTQICRIVDKKTGQSASAEGLFYQLIVRLHRYSLGRIHYYDSVHWQRGLVLDDDYNGRALLEHKGNDVHITVRAPYPQRFLTMLTEEVKYLVESFWEGLRCDVMVPCINPNPCIGLLEVGKLIENKKRGRPEQPCPICNEWQSIDQLLLNAPAARPIVIADLISNREVLEEVRSVRRLLLAHHARTTDRFDMLDVNMRETLSKIDVAYNKLLQAFTDEAKEGPRLFSLVPVARNNFNPKKWVRTKFRLTLWCESSQKPLPELNETDRTKGVYEIELDHEWFKKAAPYLKLVTGTLSLVLPVVASSVKLTLDDTAYKAIEEELDFSKSVIDSAIGETTKIGEFFGESDSISLERGEAIRAQGATLRELHALLKAKDPGFGGLVRVMNKRQEFLWVHEKFAGEY